MPDTHLPQHHYCALPRKALPADPAQEGARPGVAGSDAASAPALVAPAGTGDMHLKGAPCLSFEVHVLRVTTRRKDARTHARTYTHVRAHVRAIRR